jgi:predicted peptidase
MNPFPWTIRIAALLMVPSLTACRTISPTRTISGQQPNRFEKTIQRQVTVPYLLFRPENYEAGGPRKWPLLVFLHGAGERGTDLQLVTAHGPPKLVKDRPDFPFVVVSPQCPKGESWDIEALDELLGDLLSREAIDPKQVYLTGLSMGGYGAWAWAAAHPERFAAIVPICGGGDPIRVRLADGPQRQALAQLPVWAFHGAKDQVVMVTESERMVEAYRMVGNEPKLTVYPEANHDAWTETYADPALYDWLLQHHRP